MLHSLSVTTMTRRLMIGSTGALLQRLSGQEPIFADPAASRLREIETELEGRLGVSALHVVTGRRIRYRANERYPMWSTYKLPIAIEVLARVDEGKERLDRVVTVERRHFSSGSGILTDLFRRGDLALSVRNLLELMLVVSDNTATAILLEAVGGGTVVTERLRGHGIEGIRVDRPNMLRMARLVNKMTLPPKEQWTPELAIAVNQASAKIRPGTPDWDYAMKVLDEDPGDQATPDGFIDLLRNLNGHKLLKPSSDELLLDMMRRCRTGPTSIKGLLPPETVVAHKSGNGPGSTNDVGLVELPNGAGTMAIAVLTAGSAKGFESNAKAIARVSRFVFDQFTNA